MAGHSKWKQIKHKKAVTNGKRSQLFSKMVREITVAVREGGPSPDVNPRLRSALERAKSYGLAKENIARAIERASGKNVDRSLQEFLYEVVGPGGACILVEGITDNNNRTLSEIKQIIAKYGAKLVPPNSLLWNFEKEWTSGGKDYRPRAPVKITPEEKEKIFPLMDNLVDHPDVQEVYSNLAEEQL